MSEEAECDGVEGNEGVLGRKEKRKMLKKMKRKEKRKDVALKEKLEEEMKLNDPEEHKRMAALEREERERVGREIKQFEERERLWMEKMMKHKEHDEANARPQMEDEKDRVQDENLDSDSFEYVEEGPAEIIWQGNEIIVKKNKVKVPRKKAQLTDTEEAERPTSNPLPPQGGTYTDSLAPVISAQQAYDSLAQQVPSFGTEQDKAHCPFHIKTGVCRFGSRCNRAHFYLDKSCTLLIKNMYSGPGLAWEQDEALEYTEEEVERSFEEFYEDVHTEFLKFGEIINFKVCRNGSAHLRGNVYVHYKMLDSALLAYRSINGRYFAGKQVKCEYVGVARWKIAICGEYMKTRLSTCSRGTACNFIHCFRNPGGDYEWADWDKPPPKYWVKKMYALFGCIDDSIDEFGGRGTAQLSDKNSQTTTMPDANRYHHSRRFRSRDKNSSSHGSHRDHNKKFDYKGDTRQRHKHEGRKYSKDTTESDCMDTMMLRNNSKEPSLSIKNSDCQSRNEVYEAGANRDRSNNELHSEARCSQERNWSRHEFETTKDSYANEMHSEARCSQERNWSRHEFETTKDSYAKHSRKCGSEDGSNEKDALGLDQVKDSGKYHCSRTRQESKVKVKSSCTNWDKGRDEEEEEERLTHKYQEENRDDRKKCRDREIISLKRMDHDRAVNSHKDGKENEHGHHKKRRRSAEFMRENSMYSHDYADKKKTYSPDLNDIHSGGNGGLRSNSPLYIQSEAVGFIDRWDPS